MIKHFTTSLLLSLISIFVAFGQPDRWQQRVEYKMEIDMDTEKHQYAGKQTLIYHNNSPEALDKVYYHLYFNAFQPGSMMDVRSRTIPDPDPRIGSRIAQLKANEIGYIKVKSLYQDGKPVEYQTVGTVLEVRLDHPIAAGSTTVFTMEWDAQVPIQIRRSGRMNREGVDYSMSQWYPKMAEYDYLGWHADPYISREFMGVWGDFDVTINIDKSFLIGATGYLQNPEQIGKGYEKKGAIVDPPKGEKLSWHFIAPNVHDFAWAADPEFVHETAQVPDGPMLHFIYKPGPQTTEVWQRFQPYAVKSMQIASELYGKYPYEQFSVIQGGDLGMEYPMATLITAHRPFGSLVGVYLHELLHSWFYAVLANNELLHGWMDEGFTDYSEQEVEKRLFDLKEDVHFGSYAGYFFIVRSGNEEPLTTHGDHFRTSRSYGSAIYSKGAVFVHQLSYVTGQQAFDRGMLDYFETWKFKHPNPDDFIRIMEKASDLELDWYKEYFIYSTKTIDYGIVAVEEVDKKNTGILLGRLGEMPMPIDLEIEYEDGQKEIINIPLVIMRGAKPQENLEIPYRVAEDWPWVNPEYLLVIPEKLSRIKKISIDPTNRMADINRGNNTWNK